MRSVVAAIVGRPNTGKSTLFNRLIGRNKAVMDDLPGVTRDRLYAELEHYGTYITLIDTGGYDKGEDYILKHIIDQVHLAVEEAEVVVLVVDGKYGLNPLDKELAELIRKNGKDVVLAINKMDHFERTYEEFYKLGIEELVLVSSAHSRGLGDLLDSIVKLSKNKKGEKTLANTDEEKTNDIKISIAGRPNTGKSTLLNAIAGQKRSVTSHVPGTTRDVVDLRINNQHGDFILLDTAGIRRYAKTESNVEVYSIMRSKEAIEAADVALWVVDATEAFTHQDKRVSEIIHEGGTGCVIVINKKDLVAKKLDPDELKQKIPYLDYAPVVYTSAVKDKNFDKLFALVPKTINLGTPPCFLAA